MPEPGLVATAPGTTFHPTFLYESLWNLALCGVLLWVDRRWQLPRGSLMAVYVAGYGVGRLWVETLRIDPANEIAGMRLPDLRSLRVFIGHGIANAVIPLAMARRDHRLLYTAGLSVRMHTYPTTHRIHPDMLRDVNRWIMQHINAEHDNLRLE